MEECASFGSTRHIGVPHEVHLEVASSLLHRRAGQIISTTRPCSFVRQVKLTVVKPIGCCKVIEPARTGVGLHLAFVPICD